MRDIFWYIETAKSALETRSDSVLSRALGANINAVGFWRRGVAFPNEDHMILLADLCDVPEAQALAHLHLWKAEKDQSAERIEAWQRIAAALQKTAAAVVIAFAALFAVPGQNANAMTSTTADLYIMR